MQLEHQLFYCIIFFVGYFFPLFTNKNLYKKEDTLCTVGLLTGNILMVFILKGATLALHFYLYQFKLFNISEILPIWALWILTFVMIDFVFYFYHRISHRVNFSLGDTYESSFKRGNELCSIFQAGLVWTSFKNTIFL